MEFRRRKSKAGQSDLMMPTPLHFKPDAVTSELSRWSRSDSPATWVKTSKFGFAVTRADALKQQKHFLDHALPLFGDYQDAMLTGKPFLWHSVSCRLTSIRACSIRSNYAARSKRVTEPARCRSTPPRALSGRSSAGANMCAASTGWLDRIM